ncbi:MAG: hypothetical protein HOP25_08445 [Methylotenera sp.]|nr:hypothetical protein [Methylotenera sp.]
MLHLSKMPILKFRQKGAALIFMAFILGLGAAAYVLKTYNSEAAKAKRDEKSAISLVMAKEALLAYSISRTGAGERPGNMPRPDYFASSESPANYDGDADGGCLDYSKPPNGLPLISSTENMRCLGRLPWRTLGMSIASPTQNDGVGNMPWYAVSANLTAPACITALNSSILSMPYTGYVCGSATNLPYPWLTVKDNLGNIISNRVAAVLLMPNAILSGQARPVTPLAGITNYLEAGNSDFDNEFTVATDLNMNDKLVYITIDELMAAVSRRVSSDISILLNKYNKKNTHFPYAAPLGSSLNNFISSGVAKKGMVPVDITDTCSSTPTTNCNLQPIASIAFTRVSGTAWASDTGACTRSGATCTCAVSAGGSAIGSCTRTTRTFSCNGSGVCTHNVTGTNKYTYTVPSYANVGYPTGACTINPSNLQVAVCTDIGSFSIGLVEPAWFSTNLWQDYLYYEWSPTSSLEAGGRTGIGAVLVGVGEPIVNAPYATKGSPQSRPPVNLTPSLSDYLDSAENVSVNSIYDATSKQRTNNYNDQTFVVSP